MNTITLEWDTLELVCYAYNLGTMSNGKVLQIGNVKVSLEIKSNFNILTVELPWATATLTLWDTDDDHEASIRNYFG